MCLPPTMMTGGLVGHTIAQANKPDEEKQEDPIVEANKTALKTSTKQTSQTDKAY